MLYRLIFIIISIIITIFFSVMFNLMELFILYMYAFSNVKYFA